MGLWIKNADGTIEKAAGGGGGGTFDGDHVLTGDPLNPPAGLGAGQLLWDGVEGGGSGGGGPHDHDDYLPLEGGIVTGDLQVSGQMSVFNGTSSTPTYSFWNDRTVGLYLVGFGKAGFAGNLQVDGVATFNADGEAVTLAGTRPYMSVYFEGTRAGYFGYPSAASGGETYLNADGNALVLGGAAVRVASNLQVDGTIKAVAGQYTAPAITFAGVNSGFYGGAEYVATNVNGATLFAVYPDKTRMWNDLQVDGQIKAGAAAAYLKGPSYGFAAETDTGMQMDSAGIELLKKSTRVAKFLVGSTYLPGVYATTMGSSYKADVMVMFNGQLVRISGANRTNMVETEAVNYNATNSVYDLKPIWFRSTCDGDNPEHSYYGLAAEDCAAIDPRLAIHKVNENGVEVADDVNTNAVVALLVSAVKTQRDTIAELSARIDALEGQTRL